DVKTLARIQGNLEKANSPSLSSSEKQMIMMALLPSLPNIITPKSEINIDADFNTPDGKVTAKGYLRLKGNDGDAINMMNLRKNLLVDIEAKAPSIIIHSLA